MTAQMLTVRKDVKRNIPHVIDVNSVYVSDQIITKTKNRGLNHNF